MNQRERQRLETRRRIYECAIKLFEEKSYDMVRVSDIVKAANVSIGAFYHHFPSKENLIDEGYRSFDEMLEDTFSQKAPAPGFSTILFLTGEQLQEVVNKGVEVAGIFFKNQIGIANEYIFDKNRFFYRKLVEHVALCNHTDNSDYEIVESILRASRGTIYDWCLHNGSYDLLEIGQQDVRIQLEHFKIL
ncbi:TetR/AcrR family transcriptional regulator [Eubacteriaceae bacterium ES2]|nr:TetR/AcrR family transcriptional regulator [Eubacteriaceae bacterium ES2]